MAWLPYELKKINTKVFTGLCIITCIVADIAMGFAWFDPTIAPEEFKDLSFKILDARQTTQRDVASYINEHHTHAKILMDSCKTYIVIMNTNHPRNIVVSSSNEFKAAVKNPKLYHIDYLVIPSIKDNDTALMDVINIRYPYLYKNGADWCTLEKEFGHLLPVISDYQIANKSHFRYQC